MVVTFVHRPTTKPATIVRPATPTNPLSSHLNRLLPVDSCMDLRIPLSYSVVHQCFGGFSQGTIVPVLLHAGYALLLLRFFFSLRLESFGLETPSASATFEERGVGIDLGARSLR